MAMTSILENAGMIVTEAGSWVVEFVGTINSQPLLQLFVILPLVGLGVGLIRRMIRL